MMKILGLQRVNLPPNEKNNASGECSLDLTKSSSHDLSMESELEIAGHPIVNGAAERDSNILDNIISQECTQGVRSNAQEGDTSKLVDVEDAMEVGEFPTTPHLHDSHMEEVSAPQTHELGGAKTCTSSVCHNASTSSNSQDDKGDVDMQGGEDPMSSPKGGPPTFGTNNEVHMKDKLEATPRPRRPNAWKVPKHHEVHFDEECCPLAADGRSVKLNPLGIQRNRRKLERALVGHTLGKKLPYAVLKTALERKWGGFGEFTFLTLTNEYFLCIFEEADARDAILMKGPWYIAGQIIGLDKWTPSFNPATLHGLSSPVWIRLPLLPLLYWDNDNIARIASRVGKPLWVDSQTDDWGRCSYARICVRVDLSNKLPHGVWVEGVDGSFYQRVEYEGLPQLCFHCGRVGHKAEQCRRSEMDPPPPPSPHARPQQVQEEVLGETSASPQDTATEVPHIPPHADIPTKPLQEGYGAWTLVSRRKKQGHKKVSPPLAPPKESPGPPQPTATSNNVDPPPPEPDIEMPADPPPPPPPTSVFGFTAQQSQSSSRSRAGQRRVSKTHFLKEIAQLGPIVPMKRKKDSYDAPDMGDHQSTGVT